MFPAPQAGGGDDDPATRTVALSFFATKLVGADLFSKSDPFVMVFKQERNGAFTPIGRTETINNNHNPRWIKQVEVPFHFEEEQVFLARVYDDDFGRKRDDELGDAKFKLSQLMGTKGQKLRIMLRRKNGRSGGELTIIGDRSKADAGTLHLALQGKNLDRKDGWFGKSDPYFVLAASKSGAVEDFVPVFKSDHIRQTLNPVWDEVSVPLARLQVEPPAALRLEVWDWDSSSKSDLIGFADITLEDLINCRRDIALKNPKPKHAKKINCGLVDVVSCRVDRKFSFIDYLRGGLNMNLIVAVDFTGSNGDPSLPGTLHYGMGHVPNPYTEAISAVGAILLDYDTDKMVPAFGFGAKPTPAHTEALHCFALNGNDQRPEVRGMDGVLSAYRSVFDRHCILSKPTIFSQVVNRATALAMSAASSPPLMYSMLLLITDGAVTDLQDTIDALVRAAHAPLSVVIVGVGNADFSSMVKLDGDVQPLVSRAGERTVRDIVQFVPYERFKHDRSALMRETLYELPGQVVQYYAKRKIPPGRPVLVSDQSCMVLGGGEEDVEISTAQSARNFHAAQNVDAHQPVVFAQPVRPPPPRPNMLGSESYPSAQGSSGYFHTRAPPAPPQPTMGSSAPPLSGPSGNNNNNNNGGSGRNLFHSVYANPPPPPPNSGSTFM